MQEKPVGETQPEVASRFLAVDFAVPRVENALNRLRRGAGDPTHRRLAAGQWLRASRLASGTALLRISADGTGVHARAWGAGADEALERLPRLIGLHDTTDGFVAHHHILANALQQNPWLTVGATDAVVEAMAPACLEQVVTGKEAFQAFRELVAQFGEPAPGPVSEPGSPAYGMRVQPTAAAWAKIPSWTFLAAGVEQRRSRTLVTVAQRGTALERTLTNPDADAALRSLPGVGAWTSAEVRQRAHGDPDAWSIGDYHVAHHITFALTGEQLDDDACEEILEPYRGHRYRVQQLLGRTGVRRERRGPKMTLPTHTPRATRGRS